MRKDPYSEYSETTTRAPKNKRRSKTEPEISGMINEATSDDPFIRVELFRQSGRKTVLIGEQIDGDNPDIQELALVRSSRRYWRFDYMPEDTLEYNTDDELLSLAQSIPKVWDTVKGIEDKEEQLRAVAERLHMVAKNFITDGNGKEIIKNGKMVPASGRTYVPGTHIPVAPAAT